jgi:hypothetical protein
MEPTPEIVAVIVFLAVCVAVILVARAFLALADGDALILVWILTAVIFCASVAGLYFTVRIVHWAWETPLKIWQ